MRKGNCDRKCMKVTVLHCIAKIFTVPELCDLVNLFLILKIAQKQFVNGVRDKKAIQSRFSRAVEMQNDYFIFSLKTMLRKSSWLIFPSSSYFKDDAKVSISDSVKPSPRFLGPKRLKHFNLTFGPPFKPLLNHLKAHLHQLHIPLLAGSDHTAFLQGYCCGNIGLVWMKKPICECSQCLKVIEIVVYT